MAGFRTPQRPWQFGTSNWQGQYETVADLPNVAGSFYQPGVPNVQEGDLAWVALGAPGLYLCVDPTLGAAVWTLLTGGGGGPRLDPGFEWNLNDVLGATFPQPASFDGLPTSDPSLSGSGPFDGARLVRAAGTLLNIGFILRVPADVPGGTTSVEFYRVRAGVVTSLGVASLFTVAPTAFSSVSVAIPGALAAVLPGDLLFVSLAAVAPVGAADLSAYIEVAP